MLTRQQAILHAQGKNDDVLNNLEPVLDETNHLSPLTLGLLKRTLGNTYRSAANWHLGEKFLTEAVKIAEESGDIIRAKEWKGELGRVYRSSGLHKRALELQKEANEAALARGDTARLAAACGYIGFTNYSLAKPNHEEAIKYLGTRLYLCQEMLGDPEGVRWCLNNIGKVYLSMGAVQAAIQCFEESLKLVQGTGNLLGEGTALGNLGSALREAEKYEEAIKYHKQYLTNAGKRLDTGGEAIMLYELAVDHMLVGDLNSARDYALKGVVTLRNIHARLSAEDDQLKIGNFEKNQAKIFNILQHILTELGQNHIALLVSELGRARTLADVMQTTSNMKSQLATDLACFIDDNACLSGSRVSELCAHLLQMAHQLNSTIVVYSLINLSSIPGRKGEHWVYIWVVPAQQDKISFTKRLMTKGGVVKFQLDDDYLSALRRDIGVSNQTFARSLDTCAIDRDIKLVKAKKLEMPGTSTVSVSSTVAQETTTKSEFADKFSHSTSSSVDQLRLLYDLLINPVKEFLPSESATDPSRLIFIPHNIIFSVPFAGLRCDDHYLVEHYIISQAPSLTILDILIEKQKNAVHDHGRTLVAGNPDMPHADIPQLEGAEEEARTVHRIMGGKLLLKGEATKQSLKENLHNFSIIHLATHATLADSIAEHLQLKKESATEIEGDYSIKGAIVLSKSSPSCSGILTSNEVVEIGLDCELMTLSCCRTGCGIITGDGILGLSRAVLMGGARCFIVTLWAIEDKSTSKLMQVFYSHYKDKRNAPESLRLAMLVLLRDKHTIAQWAAFCVSGVSPGMINRC
jgi:CHAT domain-containing protein